MRQLLFLLLFVSTFIYANSIELTPKEKLFIKENPKITLGVGNGWDPAVIVKGDKVDGFDADILNLINKATGANFVFEVGIWKDIQELAKNKKIYGLMDIVKTKDRDRFLNYSNPYSVIEYSIGTNEQSQDLIKSKDDYKNLTFGYQKGHATHLNIIKELNLTKTMGFSSLSDISLGLREGTIDIAPIHNGYNYSLAKNGLPQVPLTEHYFKGIDVFIGIHKDYPEAISIINKALKSIGSDVISDLRIKWSMNIHSDNLKNKLNLSAEEKQLILTQKEKELIKNNTFNLCLQYNLKNRNYIENGVLKGTIGEIYNEISKLTGLKFNYVVPSSYDDLNKKVASNQCDAVTVIGTDQKRFNNIVSSEVVSQEQMVAVAKIDHIGTVDFGEDIFYSRFTPFIEEMKKHYPDEKYVHIKDTDKIATLISNNKHDVVISTLHIANNFIQKHGYDRFKVIQKFPNIYNNLSTGVNENNPLLLSIINKSIEHIGQEKIDEIFKKYELKSYTINRTSYEWLWYIVAFLVLVGIGLQYKYVKTLQIQRKHEKESQEELQYISNLAKLSAWSFDVSTMTFEFSKESQELYGLIDTPYIKVEDFIVNVYKEDQALVQNTIQNAIENDVHDPITYRFVMPDGSIKHIYVRWQAIYDRNGIFIKAKGYNYDSTEEVKFYEHEKVLLKNAALGEMIGNIAHQWRQPLSVISSAASGCLVQKQMGVLDDKDFEIFMNEITKSSGYLSETINTFSNFVKENKKLESVNIKDVLNEAIALSKPILRKNEIELKDYIDYKEELIVEIVSNELIQVIMNLIHNAKDVMVEKQISEPWIKLSLVKTNQKVILRFEDNGGGIPAEVLPKIFEPYFTTKHQSQGTGLGLYMSYRIITESLGGEIHASNTQNGALFTIELPLK